MGDNEKKRGFSLKAFLPGQEAEGHGTRRSPIRYLLVIAAVGAALMLAGNFLSESGENAADTEPFPVLGAKEPEDKPAFGNGGGKEPESITDYENRYENQLKETLQEITGVSDVTVLVNVDATEEKILERNRATQSQHTDESDREGGKRKVEDQSLDEQTVIIRKGDGEEPIILKTMKPEIRGVVIVAKGADNIKVKKWIVEAVTRALDVPAHRVSVLPKK
ncbi:stage III sporulation protein AG [Bacillus marinisedimentorum]|uniref:stage III sporulation protein AG n=1 Tax=Bacillus marinisedimentorum TaxID=1821260 RepID=UPI000871FBA9|nr:stage III sporulation protein AG [Bacillus marinisedimentorum]